MIFITLYIIAPQFSSVQLLSHVRVFATSRTAARQASLFITNARSLLKLTSMELVMPSNHLIPCRPLLLLPSLSPSIRVFPKDSVLPIRWPKDRSIPWHLFITGRLHLWMTILQWPLPLHPLPLYPPIWSFLCFFPLSYCLLLKYNWPKTLWILVVQCSDLIILCTGPLSFFKIDLLGCHQILTGAYGIFSCGWELLAAACGISLPQQGSNPGPLQWECSVLATGPLG